MSIERITINPSNIEGQPSIRNSGIKFWDVYRDLSFHGMTDHEVLRKYPALEPEDLAAVREYAVHLIQSRSHDEFTGRPILPKDQLRHGAIYKGRCRNATIARWNGDEQCFYHWREKFGEVFIETIKYPTGEQEPWWDVFDVVEELPNCRFEIPFDADALFSGNRDDLFEYNAEMWRRPE
jgi:uncharacterized protein (DUF433 family)